MRPNFRMVRCAVVLFVSATLHGCTWYNYNATHKPIASNIVGRCFELRENAILSEHFSYFTAYMLSLPGANECTPQEVWPTTKDEERYKSSGFKYPKCTWVPVANVAKETKFRVTKVTEHPPSWGPGICFKIEVKLITGKSASITSGIPACHFDFPEPELWLRMKSGHQYVEPLELSDRVARPCTE